MEYIRFSENYKNNILIPAVESPFKYIKNIESPYFISMMKYSDKQYNEWLKTKSLAKMTGSSTDRIWADFDSKDVRTAFEDAKVFYTRLKEYGLEDENIQISFSGNKGVGFIVDLEDRISLSDVTSIVTTLAKGLKTFDTSMYDNQRIFRLLFTKNEKSGLYKIPLTSDELVNANLDEIVQSSKNINNFNKEDVLSYYKRAKANSKLLQIRSVEKTKEIKINKPETSSNLKEAMSTKPRHWKDYKWSLAQGFFEPGERHNALMVVAATCRGLGYDKHTAYYICKSALKKQAAITGEEEFDKSELFENIIERSVYSDNWEGGQYSPKTNPWLAKYCERMGFKTDEVDEIEAPAITLGDMSGDFYKFSKDFEKNILKTGIKELDDNATLTVTTLNGLLGQPGAGKTSMAINYLRNTSMQGVNSMFFSLDMGKQIVYSKLVQKETGLNFKESLDLYRYEPEKAAKIAAKLEADYKNVGFNFRAGTSVADIRRSIKEREQLIGGKVKLVVVDYLECIQSSLSDPTAGGGQIAGQLKDVANEEEVCILLLLQTQKHSTPEISDPLLSLKQVKGSSVVEQSCSSILTLWREGYSPKYVDNDRYISFAVVKNRFGGLWSGDFSWDGVRGNIESLAEEEKQELKDFRRRKKEEKAANELSSNKGWE
jgi:KaiC/GvpD/RAD55 family RecA-like ATPase